MSQFRCKWDAFSREQKSLVLENLLFIEGTEGCSISCDFCAYDTPKGVRDTIHYEDLELVADELVQLTSRTKEKEALNTALWLYGHSEPCDYEDSGKNYFDVHKMFQERGFKISVITAVPQGKEQLVIDNLSDVHRISVSHMNRERLAPFFKQLGIYVYIDLANYYRAKFPSGNRPKNVDAIERQIKVENRLSDTLTQLRLIDPDLPTKTRFYDIREDKTQQHEFVQTPDVLRLWCGNGGLLPRDGKIIDIDEIGVSPYGRAKMYPERKVSQYAPIRGYCNYSGVKITPAGVFNVVPVVFTRNGEVVQEVVPSNFQVVQKKRYVEPRFHGECIYPEELVRI